MRKVIGNHSQLWRKGCCVVKLAFSEGAPSDSSPKIYRLVPEDGYTAENVMVLCWRCNVIKRDSTVQEMYRVADWCYEEMRKRGRG